MKKIYIYITILLISIASFSCKDWLDVDSEDDVYKEELFTTVDGYYAALNGLYQELGSRDLYGVNLVWYFNEAWGKSYDLIKDKHDDLYQIVNNEYNKNDAQTLIKQMWGKAYYVIAQANALIQAKESDNSTLFPYDGKAGDAVLGEAIAIRALMHFELVKLYTPAPITDNGGESAIIPYVDKFPNKIAPPVQTKVILDNVVKNLLKAKDLVQAIDTCVEYDAGYKSLFDYFYQNRVKHIDVGRFGNLSDDEYWRYRGNRMNYYAILGTLARVYLYMGDNANAYKYAKMVTDKESSSFVHLSNINSLGDQFSDGTVDNRLCCEMIFAIFNPKIDEKYVNYYFTTDDNSTNSYLFYLKDYEFIFKTSPNDKRAQVLHDGRCMKFSLNGKDPKVLAQTSCLIPVLRLPELYLIEAESLFDTDKAKAIKIFNYLIKARGSENELSLSNTVSKDEFINVLLAEYKREFLCEGISVYVHKRLNKPFIIAGEMEGELESLVLPVPDSYNN